MATRAMMNGMTTSDRIVAWTMMVGLALALVSYGQALVLPAHFV